MRFALAVVTACLSLSATAPIIKFDGSSTVFPITEAVAEEFQRVKKSVRITVGISGTGGGFKKFCRGEIDIQSASRPITKSEMENCHTKGIKFFEVPIAFDATAIVVNTGNAFVNQITVTELKKIWEPAASGKVMKWNQVNKAWPDQPLTLYGAGADSGTFDYFTEAIMGKAKASRGDYTASEDDNVLVQGIKKDKNAIGYLPLAYYEDNKKDLKLVAVVSSKNKAILPNRETVESGAYEPLSRPLFLYVTEAAYKRSEVKELMEFYLSNAHKLVPEVKYVPLPAEAYKMAQQQLQKGKMGTAFNGHSQVGLTIKELMKREKHL